MITLGSKVYLKTPNNSDFEKDRQHIGTVEEFRPSKTASDVMVAYVRWHRGYAKWYHEFDLLEVEP